MIRLVRLLAGATVALLPVAAAQANTLEPYQMVRSLQLVQDRIADGDHAALPMQGKLLAMIDSRLRAAPAEDYAQPRNLTALFVYGLSGGNPATVIDVFGRLDASQVDPQLLRGVGAYLRNDLRGAGQALAEVDPATLDPELGAFVSLVKGSLQYRNAPKDALPLLDRARLLAPGTLVEEAALRRSLPAAAALGDGTRFLSAASQYVRRFLRSPYATQFADELVKGVVALHDRIELPAVEAMIADMPMEHQRVAYLRLARASAIDGLRALSDFAAARAARFDAPAGGPDARALLYSNLASVSQDDPQVTLPKLQAIDRNQLGAQDRKLLDAAIAVASGVLAAPEPVVETPPLEALPPLDETGNPSAPAVAGTPAAIATPPAAAAPAEPSSPFVSDTRRMLDDIDRLLTEAK